MFKSPVIKIPQSIKVIPSSHSDVSLGSKLKHPCWGLSLLRSTENKITLLCLSLQWCEIRLIFLWILSIWSTSFFTFQIPYWTLLQSRPSQSQTGVENSSPGMVVPIHMFYARVAFFPAFSEWSISKQHTHTNPALDTPRKSHDTLGHLNLDLVCNNACATSCPPCETKNGAFQITKGMKEGLCSRESVGRDCNGVGKVGDKEGHWEWSSQVVYQSQFTHFKMFPEACGSSDIQILDFYNLLPLWLSSLDFCCA